MGDVDEFPMETFLEPEVVMEERDDEIALNDLPFTPTFEGFGNLAQFLDEEKEPEPPPRLPLIKSVIPPTKTTNRSRSSGRSNLVHKPSSPEIPPLPPQYNVECSNVNPNARFEFLGKVFRADCMPVFTVPDKYNGNLECVHEDEMSYFNDIFTDVESVKWIRLHCTICAKHLGCSKNALSSMRTHCRLSVLICDECAKFYGSGDFPVDKTDHTELYCKWCGQGGSLVCCSFCPKGFCYKCIRYNFSDEYLKKVQEVSEWACFCCAQKPLWPLRAVSRALFQFVHMENRNPNDISECCSKSPKNSPSRKGKSVTAKSTTTDRVTRTTPTKVSPISSASTTLVPLAAPQPKLTIPPASVQTHLPKPPPLQNMSLPRCNILRSSQNVPLRPKSSSKLTNNPQITPRLASPQSSAVNFSRLPPPPQLLPARLSLPATSPPPAPSNRLPNSIPDVHVDHAKSDSSLVRLRLTQNKEQYIRIIIDGACLRPPSFPPSTKSYMMRHLQDAFRINSRAHEKLTALKNKMDEKGASFKADEMEQLREILSKWKQVITHLEDNLESSARARGLLHSSETSLVIDLETTDELSPPTMNFFGFRNAPSSCRDFMAGDSDVEIVDEEEEKVFKVAMQINASRDREIRKRRREQLREESLVKNNIKQPRVNGTEHVDISQSSPHNSDHENTDPSLDPLCVDNPDQNESNSDYSGVHISEENELKIDGTPEEKDFALMKATDPGITVEESKNCGNSEIVMSNIMTLIDDDNDCSVVAINKQ